MQRGGTQHFYRAIHVKSAPQLDKNTDKECIQLNDTYITCEMLDIKEDNQLYTLVQRQVHHHTRS